MVVRAWAAGWEKRRAVFNGLRISDSQDKNVPGYQFYSNVNTLDAPELCI